MSLQDILNKRYGGESSGRDVSSSFQSKIAERYNPLVNYRKQQKENERIRKENETIKKQQEAIQQFQQKQKETQRRSERGGLINFVKNAYQGINQAVGRGETLPEIQGGSNLYQAKRQSQLAEQDYKKRILARGSKAVLDFGKKKADAIRESEEERGKLGTVIEAGKGFAKNSGELASGLGKIGLEFSPLTGMSGIRKVVSFVGGQRVEEYLDRSTPEYQKKVDAFVDENGILNYKAKYSNEIQKTGGVVAEIGSWFIPITRSGTAAKLEKTIADIPKVSKLLNATPKVVKVGEKLAYEVSKDVVDIAILDAVRGKTWEEIQEDAKLGGIGSFGLRGVGGAIGDAIKLGKSKKFVGQIEKSLGKLDDVETKIVKDLSAEGKTLDDIATDIMAKREQAGIDIYKDLDVSKSFDNVSKTPSTSTKPPKRSVETIKPETPVKPPVKELDTAIQTEVTKATPKAKGIQKTDAEIETGFSKHFEKIKEKYGFTGDGVDFTKKNNIDLQKKAYTYTQRNPKKALRIAYNLEKAPDGQDVSAIRRSLMQSLKENGRIAQAEDIARLQSKGFTEAGQQLNVAKLDAGERVYKDTITKGRLEKIGKNIDRNAPNPTEVARKKIARDSKIAGNETRVGTVKELRTKTFKEVDSFINKIIC